MPQHLVLQPNGKYAVWSTIVDNFLSLDSTRDEILSIDESYHDSIDYPGGLPQYKEDLERELEHIEKSGIAWDWAGDWNDRVRLLEQNEESETLKIIDDLGLPRRMKRKHTMAQRERFWHRYWRNKYQLLELETRRIKPEMRIS